VASSDIRRLALAVACSIALHEIAIVLIPPQAPPAPPDGKIVAHVTIARIVPTPAPRPSPTPTPPPEHAIVHELAAAGAHARIEPIKHIGSKRPTPPHAHYATPDAAPVPTGGEGAGAQNGAGAGSQSTVNGNGNGTGSNGSGNGATICGAVDFEATGKARYDAQHSLYERSNIIATVYYADGSSERIPLDWTWTYANEDADPFNPSSSAPMLFQFPPEEQRANEPEIIQYIIAHTTPAGRTNLNELCPSIPTPR
jgi:hypothetical protein